MTKKLITCTTSLITCSTLPDPHNILLNRIWIKTEILPCHRYNVLTNLISIPTHHHFYGTYHFYGGSKVYACQVNLMANFSFVYCGQ